MAIDPDISMINNNWGKEDKIMLEIIEIKSQESSMQMHEKANDIKPIYLNIVFKGPYKSMIQPTISRNMESEN